MPIRTQGSGSGTDGNHLLSEGLRKGRRYPSPPFRVSGGGDYDRAMGYLPDDDGRDVFAEVLAEPLEGGDFVLRRVRPEDLPRMVAIVDDVMRERLMHELRLHRVRDVVDVDPPDDRDRDAHLVDVRRAGVAAREVTLDPGAIVRVEVPLEVVGDQLDELDTGEPARPSAADALPDRRHVPSPWR